MKRGVLKKSQISFFIIIAIIIISIIGLFLLFKDISQPKETISSETQPIYDYFNGCIKETGERALYSIGWSGGYFNYTANSTENGIAYYYILGKNSMPTKEFIQDELSSYMDKLLIYCSNDLTLFNDSEIKVSPTKTKTKIEDNKVIFDVNFPLTISKGKSNFYISKFNVIIDSRLGEIYLLSKNITEQQVNDSGRLCISCITNQINEKDFYFEINDYDNSTTIFTIIDKKYKISNEEYRFNFANKYAI